MHNGEPSWLRRLRAAMKRRATTRVEQDPTPDVGTTDDEHASGYICTENTCPRCSSVCRTLVDHPNLQVVHHCPECGHSWVVPNLAAAPRLYNDRAESLGIELQCVEDVPGCVIIHLSGYLDERSSISFKERVAAAIESGYINLIFDVTRIEFVSSFPAGSFAPFLKAVKPRGGDLVLAGMPPNVYVVFQLLGFSQLLTFRDRLEDAIAYFRDRGAQKSNRG